MLRLVGSGDRERLARQLTAARVQEDWKSVEKLRAELDRLELRGDAPGRCPVRGCPQHWHDGVDRLCAQHRDDAQQMDLSSRFYDEVMSA